MNFEKSIKRINKYLYYSKEEGDKFQRVYVNWLAVFRESYKQKQNRQKGNINEKPK